MTEDIVPPPPHESINYSNKRSSFSEERNGRKKQTANLGSQKQSLKSYNGTSNGSNLKPVLLSHAGCYQIGPPELCSEKFVFSVTLAFAANLNKVSPHINKHLILNL